MPRENPLLAVFEAVTNSFHAIDEARRNAQEAGSILVEVVRERTDGTSALTYINGFAVSDDGIGLTDENYASFCTAESSRKERFGGKGVGRFTWLVVFKHVSVESVYKEGCDRLRRSFVFDDTLDDNLAGTPTDDPNVGTTIRMMGTEKSFFKGFPKEIHGIGKAMIEHLVPMLSRANAPSLVLVDGDEQIDIGQLFRDFRSDHAYTEAVKVGDEEIEVTVYRSRPGEHRINFAAHGRLVYGRDLTKLIPGIPSVLGADGFVVACYVQGDVLDRNVTTNRAGFDLPTSRRRGLLDTPSLDDITDAAAQVVRRACAAELEEANARKRQRIVDFITEKRTEYRPILGRIDAVLDSVALDSPDSKLDRVLSAFMASVRVDRRDETEKVLTKLEKSANATAEEIGGLVQEILRNVDDDDKENLAQHVATRKVVLSLFDKRLGLDEKGKLTREDELHSLIFPMKATSKEVEPDRNNLWIIDERLSYHTYLASDVAMSSTEFLENGSPRRPDLNIFNIAWTFSEDAHDPRASITVVEFKRPERNDYRDDENPIFQVIKQVQDLRAGKVRNPATGRMIAVKRDAPAYAYIVCDLTDRLREWAGFVGLVETPDREGYFGFNTSANAYIEVISFTKLLNDARKRNAVLFEKLKVDS